MPDTKAPRVISSVGTMANLVNEVLQAAVGNHFRDKLQSMPAVTFIETRQAVQQEAFAHISQQLGEYQVETKGVYIQDVVLPASLGGGADPDGKSPTRRSRRSRSSEPRRSRESPWSRPRERPICRASSRSRRSTSTSRTNNANARIAKADGEATYIRETGKAKGAEVEAVGLARAKAFQAQVQALGQNPTALVNAVTVLAERNAKFVPEILVMGGNGGTGSIDGVAASLMKFLGGMGGGSAVPVPEAPTETPADPSSAGAAIADMMAESKQVVRDAVEKPEPAEPPADAPQ